MIYATDSGLYCEPGNFYIDPWRPVERAIITHAHSDHARLGSRSYLCTRASESILRYRLGPEVSIQTADYGERVNINGVAVSLHPAGHILGSGQIRIEHKGDVWVVSGDYKTQADPTCAPLEPLPCNTFITESTFGLPIYRWPRDQFVFEQINNWWQKNRADGKTTLLLCYALGKAQRILYGVDASIGPIYTHGAVEALNELYRLNGVILPNTARASQFSRSKDYAGSLILAPPSVQGTPWLRRLGNLSIGFASGWMRIRGMRRRRAIDRGFVLSDHADWPGLLETIEATGAERVFVTHGYSQILTRYLNEHGIRAGVMETQYEGEADEPATAPDEVAPDQDSGDI